MYLKPFKGSYPAGAAAGLTLSLQSHPLVETFSGLVSVCIVSIYTHTYIPFMCMYAYSQSLVDRLASAVVILIKMFRNLAIQLGGSGFNARVAIFQPLTAQVCAIHLP